MNSNLIKVRFVAAFLFLIYTATVWFLDGEAANTLLTVALVFSVSCLTFVLYEVVTSHRINRAHKALWVVSLLVFNWPVMLYYVFVRRGEVRDHREDDTQTTSRSL